LHNFLKRLDAPSAATAESWCGLGGTDDDEGTADAAGLGAVMSSVLLTCHLRCARESAGARSVDADVTGASADAVSLGQKV